MALTHEEDTTQGGQASQQIANAGNTVKKGVKAGKKAYNVGKDIATGNIGKIPKDLLGSTVDPRKAIGKEIKAGGDAAKTGKNAAKAANTAKNAAKVGKQALKLAAGPEAAIIHELISKILKHAVKKIFKPMIAIAVAMAILLTLLSSWMLTILGIQIGETNIGVDIASDDKKAEVRLSTEDDTESEANDTDISGIEDRTGEDEAEESEISNESSIGAYNDEAMFKDSFDEMERIYNKAAKKARKYAKKDAKSYAKKQGDRWCKVVNEKDKTIKSWKWLYTTDDTRNVPVNKADAIIVADLIIRKQKSVEDGVENPDEVEVTTKDIYDFLKDKNHLKGHFYHMTYTKIEEDIVVERQTGVRFVKAENGYDKPEPVYTQVTEKQAGSYITVYTYDLYDLFAMGGLSPNDKYAYSTTFYDAFLARSEQLKAIASEEEYEALGLAYETPLKKEHQDEISGSISAGIVVGEIVDYGENAITVWNALKDAGFSDVSAAALCGNFQAESGFRTSALSGDGNGSNGFAQWTGNRLTGLYDYANEIGLPWDSIETQTRYLLEKDLPARLGQNLEYFKTISDLTEAADYVCIYFETPARFSSYEEWQNSPKYGPNGAHPIDWSRFEGGYSEVNNQYNLDLDRRRQNVANFYNSYHD